MQITFDPAAVSYEQLLEIFFAIHDPTTPNRQGADVGTQYRSVILYADEAQRRTAKQARAEYEAVLQKAGYGEVTTEIAPTGPFFYAEEYHQQYLHKVPWGYCGIAGTGVTYPSVPASSGR